MEAANSKSCRSSEPAAMAEVEVVVEADTVKGAHSTSRLKAVVVVRPRRKPARARWEEAPELAVLGQWAGAIAIAAG